MSILLQSNSGDFGIAAILGAAVIALVVGAVVGIVILNFASGRGIKSARAEADRVLADAKAQAALAADAVRSDGERKAREIELAAEKSASEKRTALERDSRATQIKLDETLSRATKREETLDRKLESIDAREKRIDAREADLKRQDEEAKRVNEENERTRTELRGALSKLSGLTQEQARELYMTEVREQADHDAAGLRQKILDEATRDAKSKAREITLMSIQRYAAENVGESTVRSIKITSEDMKGRIIGREGRNIRAIEKATGADILVDDTPGVISVSCFDRVRQAIAAEALQRLVADGRIHPTRIEELVEQTKRDIEERIVKVGNEAIVEADVRGVHPKIVEALGKMHFRTSYGQNVLRHSIEVAFLAQMIADQLGLNGAIARRAGLLHDIGKAMDHEMEGGHPAIGMEFLLSCFAQVLKSKRAMAKPSSHISVRKIDGVTRIDFLDRNILDELNIHQIGEELLKSVESEFRPKVIVVFTNVEHMSSAAYGTFMKFNERVKSRDGQLRLCELKPRVYEGFVITKLNRIFSIHESWAAALDTLT